MVAKGRAPAELAALQAPKLKARRRPREILVPNYLRIPVLDTLGLEPNAPIPANANEITRTTRDNTVISQRITSGVIRWSVEKPEEPPLAYETSPPFNPTKITVDSDNSSGREYWIRSMVNGTVSAAVQSELAGHANALAAVVEAERITAAGLAQVLSSGENLPPPTLQ